MGSDDSEEDVEQRIKKATKLLTILGGVLAVCALICLPFLFGLCCGLGLCVPDDSYY